MILALFVTAILAVPAAPPADATKIVVSAPTTIVEIDVGKMKGDLIRLAWSADGTQVYLQTVEPDNRGNVKLRHFTMGLDGRQPKSVDQEPAWATTYWGAKSAQSAPGMTALKIAVEQQQKRISSTSNPGGGDMAKGATGGGGAGSAGSGGGSAGGMSVSEAAGATYQTQNANVITLKLKNEVVGEFVNAPVIPGLTFSWGPAGSGLIAFTNSVGKVILMDDQVRQQELAGSKDAFLPAWTADGKRLAYLEKTGRKKFTLRIVDVTIPAS